MLAYAVTAITFAFVFYTIGVWGEKNQSILKRWHLVMFWTGLVFDIVGTTVMGMIVNTGFKFNFHGVTGLLAIVLMLIHAFWATVVIIKNNEQARARFHRLSVAVWLIWLIPFVSGAMFGILK